MSSISQWLFEAGGGAIYAAHSICLTADPIIMTIFVAGDMVTFVSYEVMGVSLIIKRVYTIRFSPNALLLYGTFIMLCGLSHLAKTFTLFVGLYRFEAMVVMAMASVSFVTMLLTVKDIYFSSAHEEA